MWISTSAILGNGGMGGLLEEVKGEIFSPFLIRRVGFLPSFSIRSVCTNYLIHVYKKVFNLMTRSSNEEAMRCKKIFKERGPTYVRCDWMDWH